jgi:hypothetical protein
MYLGSSRTVPVCGAKPPVKVFNPQGVNEEHWVLIAAHFAGSYPTSKESGALTTVFTRVISRRPFYELQLKAQGVLFVMRGALMLITITFLEKSPISSIQVRSALMAVDRAAAKTSREHYYRR